MKVKYSILILITNIERERTCHYAKTWTKKAKRGRLKERAWETKKNWGKKIHINDSVQLQRKE